MFTHLLVLTMTAQFAAIEGQVRDARTHAPISLATVEIWRMQTPVGQQYTDIDGHFQFAFADARYTLIVHHTGYEPALIEVEGSRETPAIVDLVKKKTSSPNTSTSPVISLRQFMVPDKARKEFDLARKELQRQDCSKAIAHFESGLRTFGSDASVHNDLGNCYRKLGQLDLAEASFKRAATLSDSIYVSLNLAEVYTAQTRFKDAESVLREAIQKHPNAGDAYYGLALVYFQQGLLEDAEAAAQQADQHPHQIADLHLVLAEIDWRKHEPAEATDQLGKYLKEAPNGTNSERVRQVLKSGIDH